MNVSIVSVSRFAGVPQVGQGTFTHDSNLARGDGPRPDSSMSSGSCTGRSASGTATGPHLGQWMIAVFASTEGIPLNSPELIRIPGSVKAWVRGVGEDPTPDSRLPTPDSPAAGATTSTIANPCSFANLKSRTS